MSGDEPLPLVPVLTGSRCVLRPLRASDAPALQRHADDPAVAHNLFEGFPQPYTREAAVAWCTHEHRQARFGHVWGITVDDEAIGCISVAPQGGHGARRRAIRVHPARRRAGRTHIIYTAGMSTPTTPDDEDLEALLQSNRRWAEATEQRSPGFFTRLAQQQTPKYMWIGCADSRVPANELVGLLPGEMFVHRNVANVVVHSDLNALSTIQFAVEHLKVEHVIVVGHYGCGGVRAALNGVRVGLADNWLRHVQDVRLRHRKRIDHLPPQEREDVLCEMNVIEQVGNVALSTVMQDAWAKHQKVAVHGWVYGLRDGLLKNLHVTMERPEQVVSVFAAALKRYPRSDAASVPDDDDGTEAAETTFGPGTL